jgi:hypothetical protein
MEASKTSAVSESLIEQLDRAWDILMESVEGFSEEEWRSGPDYQLVPARLVHHVIETAEFHTRPSAEEFVWGDCFGEELETVDPVALANRGETLEYMKLVRRQVKSWIKKLGDEGLKSPDPSFICPGTYHLDRALYLLRHIQHHVGELSAELKRRGHSRPTWK